MTKQPNKQIDLFAESLARIIIQQIMDKKNRAINKKAENKYEKLHN